ncbi:MAG: hypothetical protein OHK0029_16010 [Armatimonadaceae bacterium]
MAARFPRTQPQPDVPGTRYQRFEPYVRSDFERCCAYCYLHEDHVGGRRHFEIDHFCPQKICPDRAGDFYNLYWCCHGCNRPGAKHGHWPSPELLALGYGFVDLCVDRFEDHYTIAEDGTLIPKTRQGEYTIEHIGLNCEELKRLRERLLKQEIRMDMSYPNGRSETPV